MNQEKNAHFWGVLILSLGVLLLLQTLELIPWKFWEFFGPALLIIWGIAILRNPDSFVWCCCFPYRKSPTRK